MIRAGSGILLRLSSLSLALALRAAPRPVVLPDEYEAAGGFSLGFAGGGAVASTGIHSLTDNPAMMAVEKIYRVQAGYAWSQAQRSFYQVGAVDSSTSSFAAGVKLSGFSDPLTPDDPTQGDALPALSQRRLSIGLARALPHLSLGATLTQVQARLQNSPTEAKLEREVGTHVGIVVLGTPELRIGFGAENLGFRRLAHVAPRSEKLSAALLLAGGAVSLHLDLKQRQRVAQEKLPSNAAPEKSATLSGSVRWRDAFLLLAGLGASVATDQVASRTFASTGLAVVSERTSLAYLVARPDLQTNTLRQSVQLAFQLHL